LATPWVRRSMRRKENRVLWMGKDFEGSDEPNALFGNVI
jgi:hypothetical protein